MGSGQKVLGNEFQLGLEKGQGYSLLANHSQILGLWLGQDLYIADFDCLGLGVFLAKDIVEQKICFAEIGVVIFHVHINYETPIVMHVFTQVFHDSL